GLGYTEPWLHQSPEDAIREVLDATRATNPLLTGVTLERLQAEGTVPYLFGPGQDVPFADGCFPTPSGKVELYSDAMAGRGLDPLPEYVIPPEFAASSGEDRAGKLILISGAAHHFVTTSMANQPALLGKEGTPHVEINPADAASRGISNGDAVIVENERGWCTLRAVVTDTVRPGVAVAPKGYWAKLSPDGRNINWTTSDALADLAGQSTFHSNLVEIRRAGAPLPTIH
ncbi:MAG: molybdopterin oxidoreductase family protein, partial [Chloroflexota bacterium]|nr:molybdopterin oxidoreductase family protein [Chloroflexota bacterium]